MDNEELLSFLSHLRRKMYLSTPLPNIAIVEEYKEKLLNSSPNGDASRVSTNEQAKEVCFYCKKPKYKFGKCTKCGRSPLIE